MSYFNPGTIQVTALSQLPSISLKNQSLLLGRDPDATLPLQAPTVSRYHATVEPAPDGRYVLYDHSTNGTFINGQQVIGSMVLPDRAKLQIGPFTLVRRGDELQVVDCGDCIRLDAHSLVIQHKGKRRLDDISLTIEPGQLVALVGGSGAGKSTLLRTLLGIERVSEGIVYLNGDDLRQNFNVYRAQIGYVPQEDIIHQDLRVKESAVKKILISILQTLEQVHSKGIIHRDIKPENIIIREQDCQPVLIDFGAVKETMGVQAASNSRTQSIVIGTFGYMPPEQTAGRPVFSSDLYSLGLTAIYMLTGKNPSELEINFQTGEIDWQKYAPGISTAIITVIERSIQPTAENRYATATEMLAVCNTASNKQKSNRIRSTAANTTIVLAKSTRGQINRPSRIGSWLKTAAISSLVVGVPIGLLSNLNFLKSLRPNEVSSKNSASSSSSTSVNYSTSNRENTDTSSNTSDADKQRNLEKLLKTKKCRNCDLTGVNLSGANLSNAELYDANLSGAVLSRANLYHAKLRNSSLANAKLDNANLYQANLSNADLEKADLTKANLAQAELENTNLGNANLSSTFLAGGRLISTNLVEANLSNANLKDTTLKQANFSKARLDGANLTGATLCSYKKSNCANLDGASLNQVIGLEQN